MPRRKQFKGVANNLIQWVLSRNFDDQGYWAVGRLYGFSKENETNTVIIDLKLQKLNPYPKNGEFLGAIESLNLLLHRNMKANKMPKDWLQEAKLTLKFNVAYKHQDRYWRSALGEPFICSVSIETDIGSIFTSENEGNCWIHNPKKEMRRYEL